MATYPAVDSHPVSALNAERILLAEELLEAAERAQNFTSAGGAMIALRRGDEIIVRTSSGTAPDVGASFALDDSLIGYCVRTGKPRDYNSDGPDTVRHPLLSALGIRSAAAVPVSCDGTICAVLAVFSQIPAAFSRTHIAILMTLRDVIGSKLQRAAVPVEGWSEAPAQPAEVAPKQVLRPEPAIVAPEPEAKAAAVPAVAPPPPTTNAAELLRLVETPPPPPIEPAPGLLGPGEDPGKFRPKPVSSVASRPVVLARPAVVAPVLAPKPVAGAETPSVLLSYGEAAQSRKGVPIKLLAGVAALLVLAAALGMYWGTRNNSKPESKAEAQPTAVAETPPVVVNPTPVTITVEAPAPKPAAPSKAAPTANPVTGQKSAALEKSAAPDKAASTAAASTQPVSAIQLAPATAKPKVEPEPAVEAPTLSATASNAGMPELPTPKAPAAALAVKTSVVVPATLVDSKPPMYPEMARRMALQGSVRLQLSISAEGTVTAVRVLSGDPMLRQTSISAVRQWRYRPATLDGHAVESTAEVSLMFKAK